MDDEEGGRSRKRSAGLGSSSPKVSRWLGDIRQYFPHFGSAGSCRRTPSSGSTRKRLLLEPGNAREHGAGCFASWAPCSPLNSVIPEKTKSTGAPWSVAGAWVEQLEKAAGQPVCARPSTGKPESFRRRNRRPAHQLKIDWPRTIRANLKTLPGPEYKNNYPRETRIGFGRKSMVACGISFCASIKAGRWRAQLFISSVMAAVMGPRCVPVADVRRFSFDTVGGGHERIKLDDPVELLFGAQLGRRHQHRPGAAPICRGVDGRARRTTIFRAHPAILIEGGPEGGNSTKAGGHGDRQRGRA